MLPITVHATELFNEATEEFINIEETTLHLEHSLLSIAKWEAKYHKPFLNDSAKTPDEFIDYIRCMTLDKNINPDVYYGLSQRNLIEIREYMNDNHTATWFRDDEDEKVKANARKPRVVTAELIYCWMIELRMPVDIFQKWHVGRLIVLIRTCQEELKAAEGDPKKKLDMNKRRALMEKRRAKYKHH